MRRRVLQPRTKPPELRQEDLMNAGHQLFLKRGVAQTSVDQIVAAAGVAKGTFYLHYPSKEALLLALQHRFVARLDAELTAALASRGDFPARLHRWIATAVKVYRARHAEHELVFHAFHAEGPRRPHRNPIVDHLARFLAEAKRARVWRVDDPAFTAEAFFAALHGVIDEPGPKRPSQSKLISQLETLFRRALTREAKPRPAGLP